MGLKHIAEGGMRPLQYIKHTNFESETYYKMPKAKPV